MKLPVLASVILFILVLGHSIRRQRRITEKDTRSFWAREAEANATRRKPLDKLDYIHIPMEDFPTETMSEDVQVKDCIEMLQSLSDRKIVNLTGFTNTDLKLEYGAPNITELTEYDQNYTLLVRTLQNWADLLWENGYQKEAAVIMEFAIKTHTDISRTYYKLAEYWRSTGEASRIGSLIDIADTLRSANKNVILRTLKEKYL